MRMLASDKVFADRVTGSGRWKDQVDAASGAFARVTHGPQYSLHSGWLD
jgi:hypothetical protein